MFKQGACWQALLLCLLFQGMAPTAQAAESSHLKAIDVVSHFQSVLLSVMQDAHDLGFKGRIRRLEPEVRKSHHLARIARLITGHYWKSFTSPQQGRFVDTFTRLVIATYAHQFHAYHGESFHIRSTQALKRGRVLVRTELVKSSGKRVHLDYVLQHRQGHWRIINIIANGVSDLALKRADYTSVLKRQGFQTLIGMLERKINRYH